MPPPPPPHIRFDRGTVCIEGTTDASTLPSVLWDPRTYAFRAPAHAAPAIVACLAERGESAAGVPWAAHEADGEWQSPSLRPYQQAALDAWLLRGARGLVIVPTGGGKTRIALAAMAHTKAPTAVLCPTRALLAQWRGEIAKVFRGPVGIIGDGERRIENVTVMTFESAYRRMDEIGAKFRLLVVDEAHHFASGARTEALEMSTAPYRLGLTATAPDDLGALAALVGPAVSEVRLGELLGTHLSDLDMVRISVSLTDSERAEYRRHAEPFEVMARAFRRTSPFGDWPALVAALSASEEGRAALRGFRKAAELASLPTQKRQMVNQLLARHRDDKVLVFTHHVDDAYRLGRDELAPVISSETARDERDAVLASFRSGALRVLVSARVLNEGIDVPDARVAILVGGGHGTRELVQRVGRVLRQAPGKRAVVYELVTSDSLDERRASRRRANLASAFPALA